MDNIFNNSKKLGICILMSAFYFGCSPNKSSSSAIAHTLKQPSNALLPVSIAVPKTPVPVTNPISSRQPTSPVTAPITIVTQPISPQLPIAPQATVQPSGQLLPPNISLNL